MLKLQKNHDTNLRDAAILSLTNLCHPAGVLTFGMGINGYNYVKPTAFWHIFLLEYDSKAQRAEIIIENE